MSKKIGSELYMWFYVGVQENDVLLGTLLCIQIVFTSSKSEYLNFVAAIANVVNCDVRVFVVTSSSSSLTSSSSSGGQI